MSSHRPTFGTANDWFNKQSQLASGLPNRPGKLIRNTLRSRRNRWRPPRQRPHLLFRSLQGQRTRENIQVTRIVPSDQLRQGTIQYLTCGDGAATDCDNPTQLVTLTKEDLAGMDPHCGSPRVRLSRGDSPLGAGANPAVMELFQQYPSPNTDVVGDGLNFRGFTFSAPAPAKLDTFTSSSLISTLPEAATTVPSYGAGPITITGHRPEALLSPKPEMLGRNFPACLKISRLSTTRRV